MIFFSALALAPCVHEFNWNLKKDWNLLASGSLAGHLVECGGQGTGGLFTDWQQVSKGYANLGFPIIEMQENGDFALSKPANTGGIINEYAVAEQMLYEVGDPANYILPDVICDFTQVKMSREDDQECVKVSGAKGKAPTKHFKVSATYLDGFKATSVALIGKIQRFQTSPHFSKIQFFVHKFNFDKTPTFSRVFHQIFF